MAEETNGNGNPAGLGAAGMGPAAEDTGPQLLVQRIYLKDCSFESPSAPLVFKGNWQPRLDLNISASSNPVEDNHHEVVLTVTVEAKQDETVAFLCEIQQAGLFLIRGFGPDDLKRVLNATCANVIFPYARETICDLVTRGGFPQLLLQPVNFDSLYYRHADQQAGAGAPGGGQQQPS
jgi:preprotein translocase subunit SecB